MFLNASINATTELYIHQMASRMNHWYLSECYRQVYYLSKIEIGH